MFKQRPSKYGAIPVVVMGIRFASQKEGSRYWSLFLMEKAGVISKLERQPVFKFPCGSEYRADFRYVKNGKTIIEDVKGFKTKVFRLKLKMFKVHYPDLELTLL